jgi:hypothetical protein
MSFPISKSSAFVGIATAVLLLSLSTPVVALATFSLSDPVFRLVEDPHKGRVSVQLILSGIGPEELTKPGRLDEPTDLHMPDPPNVEIKFTAIELPNRATERQWVLSAEISGLPSNSSQRRYMRIRYGGNDTTLEYTLTNQPKPNFSWTLKPPPAAVSIRPGFALPLGVAIGPVGATGVKLIQSLLIEQSRLTPLGASGLMLCRDRNGATCMEEFPLAASSPHEIWLRPSDKGLPPGKFIGTLTVAATEKPEGDTVSLTFYSTSAWRQWLGVPAIMFGVLVAWFLTQFAHNRFNRDQLLMPAALLAQKIQSLQSTLLKAPADANVASTEKALSRLLHVVSPTTLENLGLIPRNVPAPWTNPPMQATNAQQLFQQVNDWLVALEAVIFDGMAIAWAELNANSTPAAKFQIVGAIDALDKLVDLTNSTTPLPLPPAPPLSTLRQNIAGILAGLNSSLPAAGAQSLVRQRQMAQALSQQASTPQALSLDIRRISIVAWLLIMLISTIVGSYVIILQNLGFGLASDYFLCLFWGIGLPVGGSQLLQITGTGITTTLGVTVPK